jgi:hypothetical protein
LKNKPRLHFPAYDCRGGALDNKLITKNMNNIITFETKVDCTNADHNKDIEIMGRCDECLSFELVTPMCAEGLEPHDYQIEDFSGDGDSGQVFVRCTVCKKVNNKY